MTLDTSNNGLLAIDCFPINLQQIEHKQRVTDCVYCWTQQLLCRLGRRSYGADATGVVLFDICPQGRITGISPRPEGCLPLMGLRVAGLFPQVVKLEGDFVVRVKEATITQVSMLRYQDLQVKTHGKKTAVYSSFDNNDITSVAQ